MVVKAEGIDGKRLHVDKALLREWRHDFARMMRDQGIAANATPRAVRGQSKQAARDAHFRAKQRADSYAMRTRVESISLELSKTGTVLDPDREKLLETRRAVVASWMGIAATLDAQGEIMLAGDVRYFAKHLPPVLTDRERLAEAFIRQLQGQTRREDREKNRNHAAERTR
jgi:hypothetical protein